MARKVIKRRTYRNFLAVYNALQREKGYQPKEAEQIARKLFDALEDAGADIWNSFDRIVTAKERRDREFAETLLRYLDRGYMSRQEAVLTAIAYGRGE